MKIIDKFLIKSFIPPFAVAFGIALFVLVLQFLWVYIDEIMGKGLSIFELTELVFYLSMTMVPMALPIGVLISSVMLLGNLAEKYELSSFKSAGVGLLRVCRPLFFGVAFITVFSIVTSEYIIPWANLKFYARFYDIRKSKPALTLQDGVFNEEFSDYTIRIGKKEKDGRTLNNGVIIYGNKDKNTQLINESISQRGEMYTTADKQFIVMNLFDGVHYEESQNSSGGKQQYPFVRIKFGSWQKLFDLTQFDRQKTNENLFARNQKTQSSRQLIYSIDSLTVQGDGYLNDFSQNINSYFTSLQAKPPVGNSKPEVKNAEFSNRQNIKNNPPKLSDKLIKNTAINARIANPVKKDSLYALSDQRLEGTPFAKNHKKFEINNPKPVVDSQKSMADSLKLIVETSKFINKKLVPNFYNYLNNQTDPEKRGLSNTAATKARGVITQIESVKRNMGILEDSKSKFLYELHMKYSLAVVCLVFLFIGAPMGAIVQKGGFGYPILIAIFFFMIFMVSVIYFKNLKEHASIGGVLAAWIPVFVMIPVAIILTYRAVNDYRVSGNIFKKVVGGQWLVVRLFKKFFYKTETNY